MKYLPKPNLEDPATAAALRLGQLRLQVGQWVDIGKGLPSRFVRVGRDGSPWVVHPRACHPVSQQRFTQAVRAWTK